jgi:hypothetical protein
VLPDTPNGTGENKRPSTLYWLSSERTSPNLARDFSDCDCMTFDELLVKCSAIKGARWPLA